MRVGVGLPSTLHGADGSLVLEWARRADSGPLSSLGVLDRLHYSSLDPLSTLAAAAAVTERVLLATTIVIGPLHNTVMLAKSAASIDSLSNGRLVLGLAVGARQDDYDTAGVDYSTRGRRFAEQLASLRDTWQGEEINPAGARRDGPPILVGGSSDIGFARMSRYADGYVHGGGPPRAFARAADKARSAWLDAGRPGMPQLWGQGYFALGGDAETEAGKSYLRDYYAFTGAFAEKIAEGILSTPQAIAGFVRGYAEAGCDELVLFPTIADISQLDMLADALHGT
jgi:alkanesulfonate monooxygenase SsuD/methylene tetrahydromethanopterin reductase-like flavin-dependent oxidoreductase (luciferase family)